MIIKKIEIYIANHNTLVLIYMPIIPIFMELNRELLTIDAGQSGRKSWYKNTL